MKHGTDMTVRQARRQMKFWYAKSQEAGTKYGHGGLEMSAKDQESYLAAVRELRSVTNFVDLSLEHGQQSDVDKVFDDEPCEHCLTFGFVMLVKPIGKPGLVSRHGQGDFVCDQCHPHVAMRHLERMVTVESA